MVKRLSLNSNANVVMYKNLNQSQTRQSYSETVSANKVTNDPTQASRFSLGLSDCAVHCRICRKKLVLFNRRHRKGLTIDSERERPPDQRELFRLVKLWYTS